MLAINSGEEEEKRSPGERRSKQRTNGTDEQMPA
jgi:hypothetical protein